VTSETTEEMMPVGSREVGTTVGSKETTAVVGRSPIGMPVAVGARFVAVARTLDTRPGSRADVGMISGKSSDGLASMMLEMTSSGTREVGTALGAADTISDGAAVACEITDERMSVGKTDVGKTVGLRDTVASVGMRLTGISDGLGGSCVADAMMLVRTPGSRFEVGTAVGSRSVPMDPMMLVRAPSGISEVGT